MAFDCGKVLWDEKGNKITIDSVLSLTGGVGDVYKVTSNGRTYALKWFKLSEDVYGGRRCGHLKFLMNSTRPSMQFVWPIVLVGEKSSLSAGDRFGYLMDLKPPEYSEMKNYLRSSSDKYSVRFKSYNAQLTACIELAHAMRLLHQKGWFYQDLNHGNFCFNPDTGDIFVLDVENIIVDTPDPDTDIKGMRGYMAPEIPRSHYREKPNTRTDYYSMAVILYRLMFIDHPMEGKFFAQCPMFTDESEELLYEMKPQFCFDPNNEKNRPDDQWAVDAQALWPFWPQSLKDMFIKSFTTGVDHPAMRIPDGEWIKIFSNIRDMLVDIPNYHEHLVRFDDKKYIPKFCYRLLVTNNGRQTHEAAIYPRKKYPMTTITGVPTQIHENAMSVGYDSSTSNLLIRNDSSLTWKVFNPRTRAVTSVSSTQHFEVLNGTQIEFLKDEKVHYVGIITNPSVS